MKNLIVSQLSNTLKTSEIEVKIKKQRLSISIENTKRYPALNAVLRGKL